jgi:hypothetical protein
MIDLRLRSRVPAAEMEEKVGKVLGPDDVNLLVTGPAFVRKPDGRPLLVYLPGAIPPELRESTWPILSELKAVKTANRGMAGGSPRVEIASGKRSEAKRVASAIVGAFDAYGPRRYCRLTAWTGRETSKFRILWPLLAFIGERLRERVPERWEAQMEEVGRTHPDWVIPGTPFTTVTVNNTYETGVHKDAGDLDEGFSTLAVFRRGEYRGGWLAFPEYRVGIDMRDGDLLLMDAHEWHANTWLEPRPRYTLNGTRLDKGPDGQPPYERISVVSYFRTRVVNCGTAEEEAVKAREYGEARSAALLGE